MARSIDVGPESKDRPTVIGSGTWVDKTNPANAIGIITYIDIWVAIQPMNDVKVASFFPVDATHFSTREYCSLGNITSAGQNTFDAENGDFTPFEIKTDDWIGIYYSSGRIDLTTTAGVGFWGPTPPGDAIPCTNTEFMEQKVTTTMSLYAEGYQLGSINIGDAWKVIQNIKINIGDDWKQILPGSKINIGDVWKDICH